MKRDWLLEKRVASNLTQEELAARAGISRVFYTQVELGSRRPSPEVAMRLAKILGCEWTLFFLENT